MNIIPDQETLLVNSDYFTVVRLEGPDGSMVHFRGCLTYKPGVRAFDKAVVMYTVGEPVLYWTEPDEDMPFDEAASYVYRGKDEP